MRYFLLFDDISEPGGDIYKWDGTSVRMRLPSGEYSSHFDIPSGGETVEHLMQCLAGSRGRIEEIECPES